MQGDKEKEVYGRCAGCPYMQVMDGTGGFSFPACFHSPFKGKWTREIKTCPIGKKNWYEERT